MSDDANSALRLVNALTLKGVYPVREPVQSAWHVLYRTLHE